MKIKLFFLLSMVLVLGTVQQAVCNSDSYITCVCSVCGNALSFDEISFNVGMQRKKNRFLCQKCRNLARGKEDALAMVQAPEEELETYESAVASPSFFSGSGSVGIVDHFYEQSQTRQLIDEATWELSSEDVKKPRKIIVGKRKKNLILKKKKPQKKKLTADADVAVDGTVSVVPFQDVWLYALPPSELGAHVQLQVTHGAETFTSCSKTPAHELWCQGARCVVVTEDGYTFFDMEKNQRLFFSEKQAVEQYLLSQGCRFDFKVFIQDEYPVVRTSDHDSLGEFFTSCETKMSEAFEKYQQDTRRNDEKYNAQVDSILEKFSKL